jgi:hypothetical protein
MTLYKRCACPDGTKCRHAHRRLLSFGHRDERRHDVHRGAQSVDHLKDESCRDVSRAQVKVMRDHDTALSSRTFEYFGIWPANQLFVPYRSKVEASRPQGQRRRPERCSRL